MSVSFDLSGRLENPENPSTGYGDIMSAVYNSKPYLPASFPDASRSPISKESGGSPVASSTADISGSQLSKNKVLVGTLGFKYEVPFLKGLSAKGLFTYNTSAGTTNRVTKQVSLYNYDRANDAYTVASQFGINSLEKNTTNTNEWTSQLFLNYNRKFGLHDFGGMVVAEYFNSEGSFFSAYGQDLLTPAIPQFFVAADNSFKNRSNAYNNGRIGYISRLNYAYDGKYLVEATARYDASSTFIPSKQWGLFPGVSVGWIASKEKFLNNISWLDNLKLRVSYGTSGDDSQGYYDWLGGYAIGVDQYGSNRFDTYVFGINPVNQLGIRNRGLTTNDYTWKKIITRNVGVDASFFKGLISFSFDAFYRKVTGDPAKQNLSLPTTFGFDASQLPFENLNSYDDRGFELVVGHKNSIGAFRYSVTGNITRARSKWLHFDEAVYPDDATRARLQQSGQWKNRFFGYQALGLFQSQKEINDWKVIQDGNGNTTLKPGDIEFADFNGDGKLDYQDNHVIGRGATPEVMFGLNLTVAYKGFDVLMLWQGASNYNAYFSLEATTPFFSGSTPFRVLADYWTPQNTNAKYPRLFPGGTTNNVYQSTYWLQDATYLRLKNIQIGYTIPESVSKKAKLNSLRLYVSAFNILTFDKVSPFDPETGGDSYSNRGWYYPQQKSLNVGLNIIF